MRLLISFLIVTIITIIIRRIAITIIVITIIVRIITITVIILVMS